jgi:prolyl-tRNA synthetase
VNTAVRIDQREGVRLGDKTFQQIHDGTPVRIELGKKELEEGVCVVKSRIRSRDEAQKVPFKDAQKTVMSMMYDDHKTLLQNAKTRMKKNIIRATSSKDVSTALAEGKWVEMAWDGTEQTVERLKTETSGGTIRCFAFDALNDAKKEKDPLSGAASAFAKRVIVGKAY